MVLHGLVGNEGVKRALAGGLPRSHAWIISGPKGSGRHTLSSLMAAAFVCRCAEGQPCLACPDCVKVKAGVHPDVSPIDRFLNAEDLDKDTEVKIQAVRALRSDAFVRPNEAERKVYLIDRPLSQQDQNALLKLLEDGPSYAVFLIIVENAETLLETVRSRCTELCCAPMTEREALDALRARYPAKGEEELRAAAAACGGLLGEAVRLLDAPGGEDALTPWLSAWVQAIVEGQELPLMECSVRMQTKKFQRGDLAELYRRLGALAHEALTASYTAAPARGMAGQLGKALGRKQLLALEALAEQGRRSCAFYVSVGHSAGWFAARLWERLHE